MKTRRLLLLAMSGVRVHDASLRALGLTLPGFVHDVCSAVHPFAAGSPFLRLLPLEEHGLEWIRPPVAAAHPIDDVAQTEGANDRAQLAELKRAARKAAPRKPSRTQKRK